MSKKIRKSTAAVLAAGTAGILYTGHRFYQFAVQKEMRRVPRKKHTGEHTDPLAEYRGQLDAAAAELASLPGEDRTILSEDGLRLHAGYYRVKEAERVVLCAHGYRGTASGDFCDKVQFLREAGCDLLLIDERSCGDSEGEAITFGAKEARDIILWAQTLLQETDMPVYLYGVSLGASSVLMTADHAFSRKLSGIIADCGFSSMREILAYLLKRWMKLPAFPVLPVLDLFCRIRAGFAISEADAEKALRSSRVPVLLIHGTEDHFVPPENTLRNYEACTGDRDILLVEGAGHNMSHLKDPKRYEQAVRAFFAAQEGRTDHA